MSTTPPIPPGGMPPEGGAPEAPGSAEGGATYSPSDQFTRYDEANDAYHCSYGAPQPALAVQDPERELIVRVDRHSHQVVGFSIPGFTSWLERHGKEDGTFEIDLPPVWPMDQVAGYKGKSGGQ